MKIFRKFAAIAAVVCLSVLASACDEDGIGIGSKLRVGDLVPKSNNLTIADQNKWFEVSTMDTKVPLYKWNIAQLIDQGKPFLAVFGTPQHCTMCVDQIRRVAIMEEIYGERFAFLHIDGYKDNSVWVEWGVKGEPWTFMVDSKGKVRNIFPGQTEIGLLTDEVEKLLSETSG